MLHVHRKRQNIILCIPNLIVISSNKNKITKIVCDIFFITVYAKYFCINFSKEFGTKLSINFHLVLFFRPFICLKTKDFQILIDISEYPKPFTDRHRISRIQRAINAVARVHVTAAKLKGGTKLRDNGTSETAVHIILILLQKDSGPCNEL